MCYCKLSEKTARNFYSRTCPLRTPFHLLMNHVRSLAKIEITSWAGKGARTGFSHELVMYQKSNERARSERVSFLIQTTSVKIPYKPPAHEVIYVFYMYGVNISSFHL